MPVTRQIAVGEVLCALMEYLRTYPVGIALTSPADIELRDETIVQPTTLLWSPRDASPLVIDLPARFDTIKAQSAMLRAQ